MGAFQNSLLPGSIPDDRGIRLGGIGSDLYHGPLDAPGTFWAITDRGPNGQIKVDGKNRRTFGVPTFDPTIVRVRAACSATSGSSTSTARRSCTSIAAGACYAVTCRRAWP